MYHKKIVTVGDRIFITKCKMAMFGNSKKRAPRLKPTSEQIQRHNLRKQIEWVYYLLLLNFVPGDLHMVLTYRKDTVQTPDEAKKRLKDFIRRYRAYCKRNGYKPDYIYNTEIGRRGAIHHHIILHNHGDEWQLSQMWQHGSIQTKSYLWANYDWYGLAEYFVDKTKGGTLPDTHIKGERRYVPSQGLIKPTVRIERVEADRWHKPRAPKGYALDESSIRTGTDELSGGSYIKYMIRRLI